MEKEFLEKVLDKIADGTATDEELNIYNSWCNSMQEQNLPVADIESIRARLLQEVHQKISAVRQIPPTRRPFIRKIRVVAAAAAVLASLYVGNLLFKSQPKKTASPIAHTGAAGQTPLSQNDVPAGVNNATLTLSNGQQIVLADTLTGSIASQPGVSISKTADGQLVYAIRGDSVAAVAYNTISTARAQQYQVILPDGSKVWLNAATTLKFPVNLAHLPLRRVELEGEAYFEVVENKARPFWVHTKKQDIQELGTHFNVSSYPDDQLTKTTLFEGAVRINGSRILKPGQQARSVAGGQAVVSSVDLRPVIAWKEGYFQFDDETIYDIMRKVSRWYNVEVVYEGEIPTNTMAGSMSRFENVSKVLGILQKTGLVNCRLQDRKIYVSRHI